jgi:hypothetical protein
MLVLYTEGALDSGTHHEIEAHLAGCAECAAEVAQIVRIRSWLADPEMFEPAEDLAWQLLPEKLAVRAQSLPVDAGAARRLRNAGRSPLPAWALSAVAVVAVALGTVWMMRYHAVPPQVAAPTPVAAGNEAFLDRMHIVYAREATNQYLAGCQDLLLDVMAAEKTCAGERYDVALEVARARDLLQKKRMLETDLRRPEVARARGLCDDLEQFLVSLSMSSECESDTAVRGMERFIEKEQLLLRINLAQSGSSE